MATGEHCQNRVIFKQFFQAKGFQFCQIDSCRMGGLNEVLAVLLMAAKFGGNAEFKKNLNSTEFGLQLSSFNTNSPSFSSRHLSFSWLIKYSLMRNLTTIFIHLVIFSFQFLFALMVVVLVCVNTFNIFQFLISSVSLQH